jgi:hypothetical protein
VRERLCVALSVVLALLAAAPRLGAQVTRAQAGGPRSVTIAGGGDVLAHIRVVAAARAGSWDRVLEGVREVVRESDVAFANLETPLSE